VLLADGSNRHESFTNERRERLIKLGSATRQPPLYCWHCERLAFSCFLLVYTGSMCHERRSAVGVALSLSLDRGVYGSARLVYGSRRRYCRCLMTDRPGLELICGPMGATWRQLRHWSPAVPYLPPPRFARRKLQAGCQGCRLYFSEDARINDASTVWR